jgi:hypothetical protein
MMRIIRYLCVPLSTPPYRYMENGDIAPYINPDIKWISVVGFMNLPLYSYEKSSVIHNGWAEAFETQSWSQNGEEHKKLCPPGSQAYSLVTMHSYPGSYRKRQTCIFWHVPFTHISW